ncbi:T9SS type B sorting domain-containing protein [Poritiphilus flavus]|uniref:T9SS type B sorting domain-containing protein n=1 Tax=Poritiphilus flavus TaxID=2697053 RepID=A0A6L9EEZ3_9FLAO|nr:T9SS type B sorting domain-containing protein [Poritiphilus flavus]NAS13241.1 T9SS type B sorting domain-containing protein [Poritiphilus flavus]
MDRAATIDRNTPNTGRYSVLVWVILLFFAKLAWGQPECTALTKPLNGAVDVALNSDIQWSPVSNATEYFLNIGTTPGGTDILNNQSNGNAFSYIPPSGLLPETTYYITIVPTNNTGPAFNCMEESFTTGASTGIPTCVLLSEPVDRASGVAPDTDISWAASAEATGYRLTVGTSSGASDIVNDLDVGNVTTYDLPADLPLFQRIYVTVIPYNSSGESPPGCSESEFRTRGDSPPSCTEIIDPINGGEFVSVTTNITWIRDFGASGYLITVIEKSLGGIKILDNFDVGNRTNFKPPDFLGNTLYFVIITPYNDLGTATDCEPISFTTGEAPALPDCANLLSPSNGANNVSVSTTLEWSAVSDVQGYRLSVGTSPQGSDLVDNLIIVAPETSYAFSENLPRDTRIYVRIIPFKVNGEAEECPEQSFQTEKEVFSADTFPVPRFFTPNNDGFNDEWIVNSTSDVEIRSVDIFNRFGQLLKQMNADQGWDGNFNGRPLASDSYWYKITTVNGNSLVGFFVLKR